MSDTVRVRAKATGVVREVTKEDAKALLAWRNEDGAHVWERVEEESNE